MRAALLGLVVVCCAPVHPPGQTREDQPPAAIFRAVEFQTDEGLGWATPVQLGRLLTVAHVSGKDGHWKHSTGTGWATVLWADKKRDLALWEIEPGHLALVPVAASEPREREPLWWRFYLMPGRVPAVGSGAFLGTDEDGDYQIDGMSMPGGSGSPVVNARGELVAVVSSGFNQSRLADEDMSPAEAFSRLFVRTSFRPVVVAKPLRGRLPKRPES